MSDEERQALLAKMRASAEEAKNLSREQARERLEDERRRESRQLAEGCPARG